MDPLTIKLPKALIPVNGIPLLCYTLARLREAGINEIIINACHLGEKLEGFLRHHANFGFDIYISSEEELLGTGGGIKKCEALLREPFLLLNADIICNLKLNLLIRKWQTYEKKSVLALSDKGDPSVAVVGEKVVDFSNLTGSGKSDNYAYFGQSVLTPEIFDYLPEGFSSIVTSGFIPLSRSGDLHYYEYQGWWFDLGTANRIKQAENFLKTKKNIYKLFTSMGLEPEQAYMDWLYQEMTEV